MNKICERVYAWNNFESYIPLIEIVFMDHQQLAATQDSKCHPNNS